ncbi:MAG: hypothetical protein IKG01_14815 [Lachnospiraceae bacterium]|nr:hypothetical protein [Lachnospiraceae bacterium]
MAKTVVIRDVVYSDVPSVDIPLSPGPGTAEFFDTSDATLDSGGKMLSGVTAYADGVKYTGTITSKSGTDITASGDTVTVPAGYYSSQQTKAVASGSATAPASISGSSATVSTGTNTLTLSKTVSVTPTVSAGYVSAGTAGNSAVSLTASVTTKAAATITPGTSSQSIAANTYLTGAQTIEGDADLVASNIVYGKSIFGVDGTAKIPIISQDSTTKVLSIS